MRHWIQEVRNFIYSYHFSTGLRTTISVVVPSVVCSLLGNLPLGIVISLGALATALSDVPGTAIHKRNGTLIAIFFIFNTALCTSLIMAYPVLMAFGILVCCFMSAMLLVYGNRGGNIGIGCMLVMVSILGEKAVPVHEAFLHSFYILLGAVWYGLLSLLLWQIRPYLSVQQMLSECITETAEYLLARAHFYDPDAGDKIEKIHKDVFAQQVVVNEKQEAVRELLLKRRSHQEGTTSINKALVLIFLDMVDLQEQIMAAQTDYQALHESFDSAGILDKFHTLILEFAGELKIIGEAVAAGQRSLPKANLRYEIAKVQKAVDEIRKTLPTVKERTRLLVLSNILHNLSDMAQRIYNLHRLTRLERVKDEIIDPRLQLSSFTSHGSYDVETFLNNLTFQSHIFRHALRVSLASVTGYVIGQIFHLDRLYWILLTIVVILKPGFSITKARSYQRIYGTVAGALFAAGILYLTANNTVIFIAMLFCILGAYSFMTHQYTLSVFFVTPFVIFLLHFLHPANLYNVGWRVMDTTIGGTIAFFANLLLWPSWEKNTLPSHMIRMVKSNAKYFEQVMHLYTQENFVLNDYKLARKDSNVSAANLMSAFQRMLSEPKSKQRNGSLVYHFVVVNNSIISHIAALANYGTTHNGVRFQQPEYKLLSNNLQAYFTCILEMLEKPGEKPSSPPANLEAFETLDMKLEAIYQKRQEEVNNGKGDSDLRQEILEVKQVRDQLHAVMSLLKDMKKMLEQNN
ncbi:FUSC family protein [Chitinophaga sancti]|uniref:FUSC family membrane protein n=1 Tax=Chitinophaga sancti TaxID=1004 RepID=A0A1K1MT31_9BACT|nr:FUSC family membrane protein [Chitinophaga sancti]WQD62961.1 FUSC family membrane protein [Chitinophaga sancti]WQG91414.1 FUSC family membrane protein [Chitinophaga sancti]SFW26348.1 TIGR01666 family membrane protein [Chitinophaga sancti]